MLFRSIHRLFLSLFVLSIVSNVHRLVYFPHVPKKKPVPRPMQEMITIHSCVMFRIWKDDEFKMSTEDLSDWINYLRWSGVSYFYLYDNCQQESECQYRFSNSSHIQYTKWSNPNYRLAQISAIENCIERLKPLPKSWVLSCDLDEYPFHTKDKKSNHLIRLIQSQTNSTSQILLRSMFFGGRDLQRPTGRHEPLTSFFMYRAQVAEGEHHRTKPLFIASYADNQQSNIVHEITMLQGQTVIPDPNLIRLNHYWGSRLDKPVSELVLDSLSSRLPETL